MPQLTRYDSYEALKADTNQTVENEKEVINRHLAVKQALEHLRKSYLAQKEKQQKTSKREGTNDK